jgi:hypothetical protein
MSALLQHLMFASGQRWDTNNDKGVLRGEARKYRILEAHRNVQEVLYARAAVSLLWFTDRWSALAPALRTVATRSLALRVLCRHIAGILLLLFGPHRQMPFGMWGLFDDPSLADMICKMAQCLLDDFSKEYLEYQAFDADNLRGPESLACLAAIGETGKTDTAEVECGHSFWQREARCRCLQTIADSAVAISSTFTLHQAKMAEQSFRFKSRVALPRGRPPKPRTPKLVINTKRKRLS